MVRKIYILVRRKSTEGGEKPKTKKAVKKVVWNMSEEEFTAMYNKGKAKFDKLSNQVKGVLFGLVLGDGSLQINYNYKNARMAFRHSITQTEYFE